MKPFGHLAVPFLTICAAFVFTSLAAAAASEPQLVRVSYMQGDVRFSLGDGARPDLKKPWQQADVNLPIEKGFALATGADGRAVIEFESGSMIYLAENSVLLFERMTEANGVPTTEVELVSGTLTTAVQTVPKEVFSVDLPRGEYQVTYPEQSYVRIDSYLDGSVFTPQAESGLEFAQDGVPTVHLGKGQTLTYDGDKLVRANLYVQPKPPTEWDRWVEARYQARADAMQAALKASGLKTPIPGLTDMYASGTFSACAPYGMCWEPSEEAMAPSATAEQALAHIASVLTSSEQASLEQVAAGPAAPQSTAVQSATAQASGANGSASRTPFVPTPVSFQSLVAECPFPSWYTKNVLASTPEEYSALSAEAYAWQLRQSWSWPVCHYARWIYRNHRYHVVVRPRRPHHPVHWVRVGKQTGFVPAHPGDQKDKPPVNLKHGVFTVAPGAGGGRVERINYNAAERIEPLAAAPKEFRAAPYPEYARAEPPRIEGRLLGDATEHTKMSEAKSGDTKRNENKITYDYGRGRFMRAGSEVGGYTTKPVVVGSLSSRGGFSGSGDRGGAGRPVGGGGERGGSGGGSSGGRSGGSSGSSGSGGGSRGGGGGSSSGGGGGSSGGSSGGGGHPR